jgi:regulator of protease activity HflC (stomatin/prohibitin superfamily)
MKRLFSLILLLSLPLNACTHVDAGNVGVEVDSCSGGGVKPVPVGVGYHTTGACTSIIEYPTFQQTLVLSAKEVGHENDSVTVTSSEGLPINIDVSMSFTVNPTEVPKIYSKFRLDIDHIMNTYMRQSIREALQETFAKYTAQQLYSDMREKARAEAQTLLTNKLTSQGFIVTQFTLNETRVPPEVENAIKAKVAMTQEAQRAEQQVMKATYEGQQKVVAAQAEADSRRIAADAEAYANQKLTQSLSPTLVEYRRIQKWDGRMPQFAGSGGNMLFSVPSER